MIIRKVVVLLLLSVLVPFAPVPAKASASPETAAPRSPWTLRCGPVYSKWDFGASPIHEYSSLRYLESRGNWGVHLQGGIEAPVTQGVSLRTGLRLVLRRATLLETGEFRNIPRERLDLDFYPGDKQIDLKQLDLEVPIHVVFTIQHRTGAIENDVSFLIGCSLGKNCWRGDRGTLAYRLGSSWPARVTTFDYVPMFDLDSPYLQLDLGLEVTLWGVDNPLKLGLEFSRDLMSREGGSRTTGVGESYFRIENLECSSFLLYLSRKN